ncbi:MAG: ComF family protein [Pseudomonadota bacterium]
MKLVGGAARHVLFPDACMTCGRHVGVHGAICAGCWNEVIFIDEPVCQTTGLPFSHDFGAGMQSADAIANPPDYSMARAAAIHTGVARQLVSRLKYHDHLMLAPLMARWMVRAGGPLISQTDIIIPVPLHWQRFVKRRYNQAAELARHVGRETGLNVDTGSLLRKRATQPQVGLTASARKANVGGSFVVREGQEINVQGRSVMLIDDVYTTGATVNAAARALRKAKADQIFVLTFSRVVPDILQQPKQIKRSFFEEFQRLYRQN